MKKQGFTLAEVLVALGIVGVCAAVLAPAIVNIMPDKNKTRVIQYHATISNATVELLNDDAIYYRRIDYDQTTEEYEYIDNEGNTQKGYLFTPKIVEETITADGTPRTIKKYAKTCSGGLDCNDKETGISKGRYCEGAYGDTKYRQCLYDKLGMNKDNDKSTYKDNSEWTVTKKPGEHTYDITIDINASEGVNCAYNSSTCKKPDQFKFSVNQWGKVEPVDKLSKVYLKNVTRVNAQKDKEEAAQLK